MKSTSFAGDVASERKNVSTSSVENCLKARTGGDDGITISFLDFLARLCFGSLGKAERFLDLAGRCGVGGPGAGGGGIGALNGV